MVSTLPWTADHLLVLILSLRICLFPSPVLPEIGNQANRRPEFLLPGAGYCAVSC